jgi:hypothetical protein
MERWTVNREHKDRLFIRLFGYADMKENALSLYNALNGTAYDDADAMEVYTLEDVVYMRAKNDAAYIVDKHFLTLWEQQSTYNPNMPLRGLIYFANLYSKYVENSEQNIYGKRLLKIPAPQYVVFYNGIEERPPMEELKLSDAFMQPVKAGNYEWTATVYNLNTGKNDTILDKCKPLADYMELINRIRRNQKEGYIIEEAVDLAVESCIRDDILSEYLKGHRAEARNMCITEFNQESYERDIRAESRAEERVSAIQFMIKCGISKDMIIQNYSLEEYEQAEESLHMTV